MRAAGDEAAAYFYGWLFAGHPELRALFPSAMNGQRDRLFRALGRIVQSLSTPEELAAYLTQLGRDHRKYSVQPEMYGAVGDALMATLRAYAGPTFTQADCPRQIHLFYGARTREDLYDLPELWHLADAYRGLQLTPVTSDDPAFDGMQGNVGRVAARYMPHRECEAYVAGPSAMVRETLRVLTQSGLPRERIHYDDALLADDEQPLGRASRPSSEVSVAPK